MEGKLIVHVVWISKKAHSSCSTHCKTGDKKIDLFFVSQFVQQS